MKFFKRNQVIIYVIALMLMTAGYLNYTTNQEPNEIETSIQMEANDDSKLASRNVGDATLVSSNDIVSNDTVNETDKTNLVQNQTQDTSGRTDMNATTNVTNTMNETNTMAKQEETKQTNSNVTDDYFVKSKLERDTMYSQMIATYEKVLNSSNALETQKQSATQEITKINETQNSIMICENLIKTKGFENSIIFVNGDSVSAIIGTQEIKTEEVAQIQNIIAREMKAEIENIHIATK